MNGILTYCSVMLFGILAGNYNDASLEISVTNLVSINNSELHIAFFKKVEDFPDHPIRHSSIEVKNKCSIIWKELGLEQGEYVIAVYQDLDSNRELNKNFLGIPKEPYGFSNNIRPGFRGFDISKCLIRVPENQRVEIDLFH